MPRNFFNVLALFWVAFSGVEGTSGEFFIRGSLLCVLWPPYCTRPRQKKFLGWYNCTGDISEYHLCTLDPYKASLVLSGSPRIVFPRGRRTTRIVELKFSAEVVLRAPYCSRPVKKKVLG